MDEGTFVKLIDESSTLLNVLGVINLIGFIWLVVVAFKQRILWGFLVLLPFPFTTLIFSINYWQKAKKPFLIYFISFVIYFVVFFSAVGDMFSEIY